MQLIRVKDDVVALTDRIKRYGKYAPALIFNERYNLLFFIGKVDEQFIQIDFYLKKDSKGVTKIRKECWIGNENKLIALDNTTCQNLSRKMITDWKKIDEIFMEIGLKFI